MIGKIVASLESRLGGRDRGARQEEFGWGGDLLGISNHRDSLLAYSEENISNSDFFFRAPPLNEANYEDCWLTFPSAVKTETESNNVVHARIWERNDSDRAIVILPFWNADRSALYSLARWFWKRGYTIARLSLPYHDVRNRPHTKMADYMVSANLGRTIRSTRQAVLDTRQTIDWLAKRGCKDISLIGTSVGSTIASLTAAHDSRVRRLATLLLSGDFAEGIWTGEATTHIRKAMDGNIEKEDLQRIWRLISPRTYASKLAENGVETLLVSGKQDRVFLPEVTQMAVDSYEENQVNYQWKELKCGHYTLGVFPFNLIVLKLLTQFFRS